MIFERLKDLPEIQRKVLALYYLEDMHLREIAEVFKLTGTVRICQIHAQAIIAIRLCATLWNPACRLRGPPQLANELMIIIIGAIMLSVICVFGGFVLEGGALSRCCWKPSSTKF